MSDPFDDVLIDAQKVIDITPVATAPEDNGPFDGVPVMTAPILVERADTRPVHLPVVRAASFRANVITGGCTHPHHGGVVHLRAGGAQCITMTAPNAS